MLVQSSHSKCYPTDTFVGHDSDLSAAKRDLSYHPLRLRQADQEILLRLEIFHARKEMRLNEGMPTNGVLLCRVFDFYLRVLRRCGVVCGVVHVYSVYPVVLLNCSSEVDLDEADAVGAAAVDDVVVGNLFDGISENRDCSD